MLLILRSLIETDVVDLLSACSFNGGGVCFNFSTSRMCVSLKMTVAFFSVKGVGGGGMTAKIIQMNVINIILVLLGLQ